MNICLIVSPPFTSRIRFSIPSYLIFHSISDPIFFVFLPFFTALRFFFVSSFLCAFYLYILLVLFLHLIPT